MKKGKQRGKSGGARAKDRARTEAKRAVRGERRETIQGAARPPRVRRPTEISLERGEAAVVVYRPFYN